MQAALTATNTWSLSDGIERLRGNQATIPLSSHTGRSNLLQYDRSRLFRMVAEELGLGARSGRFTHIDGADSRTKNRNHDLREGVK